MKKVAVVRGKFLNLYEMQSLVPLTKLFDMKAFGSVSAIHKSLPFAVVTLLSPMDIPGFPYRMQLLNRMFVDAHSLWGLERALKGYDIAHTAETYYGYTQQCLNAKEKGYVKKVICTVWENIPFNNEGIRGRKGFKERARKDVDCFLAVSERAKLALLLEGVEEKRIRVIHPGIDTGRFTKGEKKHVDGTLRILFAGRLEREKGVFELLYAFTMLVRDEAVPPIELVMVGDGSERGALAAMEKRLGIEGMVTHRVVSYEEMPQEYACADMFVLPSQETRYWREQWGMVLIEAQASGLPIVTTFSGSIPENVGNAAILVNPGDVYSLTLELKRLILNPKLRAAYSRRAHTRAALLYDSQVAAQKIGEIYHEVLGL